jgi:hypothetical protein
MSSGELLECHRGTVNPHGTGIGNHPSQGPLLKLFNAVRDVRDRLQTAVSDAPWTKDVYVEVQKASWQNPEMSKC